METITTTEITRQYIRGQQTKREENGKDRLAVIKGGGYG
jgi:hypothetical protein